MRKRLLSLAAALALACSLVPGVALADEGGETPSPVMIEIGENGEPVGTAGDGWSYTKNDEGVFELVLEAGHAFTLTGHAFDASGGKRIRNKGVIEGGVFVDASKVYGIAVRNEAGGVIEGGSFTASVGNAGTIEGGVFKDDPDRPGYPYVSTSTGAITGGTFGCMVMAFGSGTIGNGTFDGPVSIFEGVVIGGGEFNAEVYSGNRSSNLGGTIEGGVFNNSVSNWGLIEDGAFHNSVHNMSNNVGVGTIAGGTFNDYVRNCEGAVVSGGVFSDGGNNNSLDNSGAISGGSFNIKVNNRGTIEGNGSFNAPVQNGDPRSSADENKSCAIAGGTFNARMESFGTIEGGTFNGEVFSKGAIAGGTFSSTGSVTSNDEDAAGGGIISGGTFDGPVQSGDPDPACNAATIAGGTFMGALTNYGAIMSGTFTGNVTNRGAIEGGFFALPIVIGEGGTVSAGAFPVRTALTGLSIAEAANAGLVASFEKDSEEANCFTLKATEGYQLPDAIAVSLGSADGPRLAAGTDYTYDTATGAVAVKKGAASGPLFLAASGIPAVAPAPEPAPPAPDPRPPASDAKLLAATGDSVLPTVVAGIALLAAGMLAASAAACRKRREPRR